MICLTSVRYSMIATVRRGALVNDIPSDETEHGHFVREQDPITGEFIFVWVTDVPEGTPEADKISKREYDVPCQAKAFTDTGYRSASNTEEFDKGIYRVYEYVEIRYGPQYNLSRRDTVTAIRDSKTGKLLWAEEDVETTADGVFPATVFEVIGANPIMDPFGTHIENSSVLKRAATQ